MTGNDKIRQSEKRMTDIVQLKAVPQPNPNAPEGKTSGTKQHSENCADEKHKFELQLEKRVSE